MKSRLQKDLVIPKELGSLSSLVAVLNEWILWPGVKHQLANTWRQAEGLDKLCYNGCLCRTSQCKAFSIGGKFLWQRGGWCLEGPRTYVPCSHQTEPGTNSRQPPAFQIW